MTRGQHKAAVRQHMINNRMWDVFNILDPQTVGTSSKRGIDLFKHHALIDAKFFKMHVEKMLADKSCCNKYTQGNLDNSAKYLLHLLTQDMYRSMIEIVNLSNISPE
eukprot:2730680-Ditylum_brightwellii.AAC.1